ncbi:MAG: magnesium-translocating P-type ATPase [Bacteroidetes bacterium]|nr:magnesium-translocating P-type ATPase [Bacteroidota bacterium]
MKQTSKLNERYYTCPENDLLDQLQTSANGLDSEEANKRLTQFGLNKFSARNKEGLLKLFLNQLTTPIILILIAAAILSYFLGEALDAIIILVIILTSACLGFWQEKGAANAVNKLLQLIEVNTKILRDRKEVSLPTEQIVPGDIVILATGNIVPGDCRLLESKDLYADEASLTGETFPAEKKCCVLPAATRIAERNNVLHMGTHIVSGFAKAVVVQTGINTEFGSISQHLRNLKNETEFEKGIRHFGYLLMEVTTILITIIFFINVYFHRPIVDSLLFSLAIAVGLTPQLLPAIISFNLARGAANMAKQKVVVKKLSAIENVGSMNVLCSDKTGTITEGKVRLYKAVNYKGDESEKVFNTAYVNSIFESGFNNPIDEAIKIYKQPDTSGVTKIDELPYDFIRKRLSVLVNNANGKKILVKGAFNQVLGICKFVEDENGNLISVSELLDGIHQRYEAMSKEGYRILGVAYKSIEAGATSIKTEDEHDLIFLGMLLFTDPIKEDVIDTLSELLRLGVSVKIITGDNALVAAHVGRQVGLSNPKILTGEQLRKMSSEALVNLSGSTDLFAEVEPNQKERILLALKKAGNVVGFIGDGINDAPALHIADVGISVNGAVDVAMEAADIILLGNDLKVLANGVKEGRKTFANTLKYIFMATSANFGNMFSMAGASVFLSYLPLLPKQVLLTNMLTDIPEMTIATDSVDEVMIEKPRRMNISFIKKFMIVFGIISSLFDYTTFAVLLYWLHAGVDEFRTGWFTESVISASLIVLVIRTSNAFYKSRPGKLLLIATVAVIIITILLPYSPVAGPLGFIPLPLSFYAALGIIILLYVVAAEITKRLFYKWVAVK